MLNLLPPDIIKAIATIALIGELCENITDGDHFHMNHFERCHKYWIKCCDAVRNLDQSPASCINGVYAMRSTCKYIARILSNDFIQQHIKHLLLSISFDDFCGYHFECDVIRDSLKYKIYRFNNCLICTYGSDYKAILWRRGNFVYIIGNIAIETYGQSANIFVARLNKNFRYLSMHNIEPVRDENEGKLYSSCYSTIGSIVAGEYIRGRLVIALPSFF